MSIYKQFFQIREAYCLQTKRSASSEQRAHTLENQLKSIIHNNVILDSELQVASKTIVSTIIKIEYGPNLSSFYLCLDRIGNQDSSA